MCNGERMVSNVFEVESRLPDPRSGPCSSTCPDTTNGKLYRLGVLNFTSPGFCLACDPFQKSFKHFRRISWKEENFVIIE